MTVQRYVFVVDLVSCTGNRRFRRVPVVTEVRYDTDDPYALVFAFRTGRSGSVEWCLARDLLVEAVTFGEAGDGDVQFTQLPGSGGHLRMVLESPAGRAVFELHHDSARYVVDMCARAVPPGGESAHVDWSRELAMLGAAV